MVKTNNNVKMIHQNHGISLKAKKIDNKIFNFAHKNKLHVTHMSIFHGNTFRQIELLVDLNPLIYLWEYIQVYG